MGINCGFNSIRFLAPVQCDKRIRRAFVLKELQERAIGQWQSILAITVEIEGENKPAQVGEWLTLSVLWALARQIYRKGKK